MLDGCSQSVLEGALAVTNSLGGSATAGTAASHANNLDVSSYNITPRLSHRYNGYLFGL